MGWHFIGGTAEEVYEARQITSSVLYKFAPYVEDPNSTGDVAIYTTGAGWKTIGNFCGPGAMFAVNETALWGLTPNKTAIFARFAHPDPFGTQRWEQVGGPAKTIIAGDGMVALHTNQETGDLYVYDQPNRSWLRIGGPGHMFAVSNEESQGYATAGTGPVSIYGVTPNQMQIWRLSFDPNEDYSIAVLRDRPWQLITGDNQLGTMDSAGVLTHIRSIIAGATELYAEVESRLPPPRKIYRYGGTPGNWAQIGSDLGELAIERPHANLGQVDILYSVGRDMKLRRYTGTGTNWQEIRQPVSFGYRRIHRIFSGTNRIFLTLDDGQLWQYSHY